jgi:hypothetical protein
MPTGRWFGPNWAKRRWPVSQSQIVAHAAPLQQHLQRLLCVSDLHNAVDVFGGAAQQSSLEDAVRDLWLLLVQQRQVDVALDMLGEPGLERRGRRGLALAVQVGEDGEGAHENDEVGNGNRQHQPVDSIERPHFFGGGRGCCGEVKWAGG